MSKIENQDMKEWIYEAWQELRKYNNQISGDVLDFIRDSALNNLNTQKCLDIAVNNLGKIASTTEDAMPPFRGMPASRMSEIAKETLAEIISYNKDKIMEEDKQCIECKPEDRQESPTGKIFCLKCGKIINSKDVFYECLDCTTIYSEEECDESAYHHEENKLICPNCCSYKLKKIK